MVRMKVAKSTNDVLDADLCEDGSESREAGGKHSPDSCQERKSGFH